MSTTSFARMAPAKKRALLAAAAQEFATHSAADSSLNRIVAACGLSKSSFYHVVESKDELLGHVVAELVGQALSEWAPPAPEDFAEDFWGRAELLWREAMEIWPRSTALNLLWRIVWSHRENSAVAGFGTAVDDWLANVLRVGRDAGAVDSDCPQELQALSVQSLLRSFDEWTLERISRQEAQPGASGAGGAGVDRSGAEAGLLGVQSGADDAVVTLAAQQFRLLRRLLEA